jgi:hypothetical protein
MMTNRSDAMRHVVAALAPELKNAGFRKRRHSFNRTTEPGVVQVVDFQMEPHRVPPGSPTPAGLVDGSFRIELGVYADALALEDWERRDGKWVSAPDCQIRAVIGELLYGKDHDRRALDPRSGALDLSTGLIDPSLETVDLWWSLADVDLAVEAAGHAFRAYGLPWLNSTAHRSR